MLSELWKSIPLGFKALWIGGLVLSLGLTGFVVWAVYTLVMHVTAG